MEKFVIFLAAFVTLTVGPSYSVDNVLQIYPAYTNYLLKIGAKQEIKCSVNTTGDSDAKIKWNTNTMDGVTRRDETNMFNSTQYLKSSLRIENFSVANSGEYMCVLLKKGEEVSTASIFLKPVVETKTEPLFVRDSKTATLSCSISYDGFSPADVTWLKNDEVLEDNDRYTILKENQTLIIKNPIRDDAGLYVARFKIEDKEHPYDCDVHYNAGPLVLDFEKSRNIIEGDDLELECIVKGYPYSVVTWFKNEKILNDSRVVLQDLNGHKNAHLLIRRVKFIDAGEYSCEAYSATFANETSAKKITVRVKDKLAALWPFLGIVGEVVLLCAIIFIYEKRRSKENQLEDNAARDVDGASANKNEGLRHRHTNNPTA